MFSDEFEHSLKRTLISAALALIAVMAVVWFGMRIGAAPSPVFSRVVEIGGREVGRVVLNTLERKEGKWGLAAYFEPAGSNLDLVHQLRLQWWQIVERTGEPGYPRMDLQRGSTLPGNPGDDDDPSYYTRHEKLGIGGQFTQDEIFGGNRYWMLDVPEPRSGAEFETWLVRREDHTVRRLAGFRWGVGPDRGSETEPIHPEFIEESRYDLVEVLAASGFYGDWRDVTEE